MMNREFQEVIVRWNKWDTGIRVVKSVFIKMNDAIVR